jgi:hypothetical protein
MREETLKRVRLLSEKVRRYKDDPTKIPVAQREEFSLMFSATFEEFTEFCELGMQFLGFKMTPMQAEIAEFTQKGPRLRMVQAQRGEAKTTITALYAVWRLIRNPCSRILIVSAGEAQANDIAVLIIRLIEQWYLLSWLKGDGTHGDRTSYENYDVHYSLRRVEKTASVSSVGIKANLPGKRADLIIADDVESQTNSNTQIMRDDLLNRTKEFAAICTHGDILYLGTPQTRESIYRSLPSRGYQIRIWPGRYPEPDRIDRYAPDTLAPSILEALERDKTLGQGGGIDGTRGKPTDPLRYTEEDLQDKELDYGPEGFDLQYMLDTTLSDELRTKIKLNDMLITQCGYNEAPEFYTYSAEPRYLIRESELCTPPTIGHRMYTVARSSDKFTKYQVKYMVVDPAGNGGDELAYAVGGTCNGYIHLFSTGGMQGGTSKENLNKIIDMCLEMDVQCIKVESNMGHGTVEQLFRAELENRKICGIGVEGFYNGIQKEKRIIDSISPVTRRHKFILHERAILDDWNCCKKYSAEKRNITSALYQMVNITYDRQSLAKDDRADAIGALVAFLSETIAVDEEALQQKRDLAAVREFLDNPMGYVMKRNRRNSSWNNLMKYSRVRR